MIDWTKEKYTELSVKYPTHSKIIRYLIAGCSAAFTNIFLLYVFTDIVGIWYIISEVMSFVIAFVISFTLQKYWTFQDVSRDGIHRQAVTFFGVALFNLILNTILLYAFVEYFGIHYLLSQIIIGVFIAIENFFIYQFFIFRRATIPIS